MGVLGGFLMESAVLGAIGGMLGLALGRLLSLGAIRLIGNTVQLLYVSSRPAPIAFTPYTVLSGLALGIGVSVIAAMAPAVEASRVPPTEAMARGRREWTARLHVKRDLVFALALSILAIISAVQGPVGGRPLFGYLSAILIIAATAMMIPPLLSLASRMAAGLIERVFGIEALFAQRGLIASLNRTSVLVGALTTAVAMLCSVGIMVGSFRETVAVWMDSELKADLYLRPAGSSAADRHPTIAPVVADEIENIPGVAAVDRFRVYPITYQGLPASLGGGEASKVAAESATYFLPGEDRSRILAELPRGDNVVVSAWDLLRLLDRARLCCNGPAHLVEISSGSRCFQYCGVSETGSRYKQGARGHRSRYRIESHCGTHQFDITPQRAGDLRSDIPNHMGAGSSGNCGGGDGHCRSSARTGDRPQASVRAAPLSGSGQKADS
jgi:putative ABC transport system permease protein